MTFTRTKNILKKNKTLEEKFFNDIVYSATVSRAFGLNDTTLYGIQTRFNCFDPDLDVIYIRNTNTLVPIGNNILVLDFVADSFNQLKNFIKKKKGLGVFSFPENDLLRMEPKKAYVDFAPAYNKQIDKVFNDFVKYLLKNSKTGSIKDFNDFVINFKMFMESSKKFSLTRTNFITHNPNVGFHNGMTIELSDLSHDKRVEFFEQYYENPNFKKLIQSIEKFGFFVDRNAPFRIVANLNSQTMQANARERGTMFLQDNADRDFRRRLYQQYYVKSYTKEIDNLRRIMIDYYNLFTSNVFFPEFREKIETACGITETVMKKEAFPDNRNTDLRYSPGGINNSPLEYDAKFWLNLFLDIRMREMNIKPELEEIQQIRNNISSLLLVPPNELSSHDNNIDIATPLVYIQGQLKRMARVVQLVRRQHT